MGRPKDDTASLVRLAFDLDPSMTAKVMRVHDIITDTEQGDCAGCEFIRELGGEGWCRIHGDIKEE